MRQSHRSTGFRLARGGGSGVCVCGGGSLFLLRDVLVVVAGVVVVDAGRSFVFFFAVADFCFPVFVGVVLVK